MFARGPTPGDTPKADVLAVFPNAVCRREEGIYGVTVSSLNVFGVGGYRRCLGTGAIAKLAWEDARGHCWGLADVGGGA